MLVFSLHTFISTEASSTTGAVAVTLKSIRSATVSASGFSRDADQCLSMSASRVTTNSATVKAQRMRLSATARINR